MYVGEEANVEFFSRKAPVALLSRVLSYAMLVNMKPTEHEPVPTTITYNLRAAIGRYVRTTAPHT